MDIDVEQMIETLTTMLYGDDVDFEPIDSEDEAWTKLKVNSIEMEDQGVDQYVANLPQKEFENLFLNLKDNGYL